MKELNEKEIERNYHALSKCFPGYMTEKYAQWKETQPRRQSICEDVNIAPGSVLRPVEMDAKGNRAVGPGFLLCFRHRQKLQVLFALHRVIHRLYYLYKHTFDIMAVRWRNDTDDFACGSE